MAPSFMSLHITPHAEGFATALMWTFEGFLASVAVAVDAKTARSRKRFVARLADIAVLRLRETGLR